MSLAGAAEPGERASAGLTRQQKRERALDHPVRGLLVARQRTFALFPGEGIAGKRGG